MRSAGGLGARSRTIGHRVRHDLRHGPRQTKLERVTDSLTVRDNRTGQEYDVPITDGTIKAADLGQIKSGEDAPGLAVYDPGFVNTASCRSAVTFIDGDKGILEYRGYPIEQLAEKSNFLEVAYLLVHGSLPSKAEYDAWVHEITYHTFVHENVKTFMQGFRYDAHPMGMLMASVGALSTFYPDARNIRDADNRHMQIVRMIAKMPTLGAWSVPARAGQAVRLPRQRPRLHRQLPLDAVPDERAEVRGRRAPGQGPRRAASSCTPTTSRTARPTRSARSAPPRSTPTPRSPPASVRSTAAARRRQRGRAADAAADRLHGEHPGFIEGVKNGNERLMGFGHRVYKNYDPRATIIKKACDDVFDGDRGQPAPRDRPGAGEDRARGRVLRQPQALPQRRLLLRPDLRGLPVPAGDVHRAVRDRPVPRAGSPSGWSWCRTRSRRSPGPSRSTPATATRLRPGLGALGADRRRSVSRCI